MVSIARTLHEDPTPRHVHVSSRRYNLGVLRTNCSHELDTWKY